MTGVPQIGWAPQRQAVALWRDPVGTLERWRRRHGDVFSIDLPVPGRVVVVGESEAAHEVLRSDPARACAGLATGRVLPLLGPRCVLRVDGAAHLDRRRLLNPQFRKDALAVHRPAIEAIVREEVARWPVGTPFRVLPSLQRLTFAVIAHLVLGLSDPDVVGRLHRLVRRATGPAALTGTWMWPVRSGPFRTAALRVLRRRQAAVGEAISGWVRAGPVADAAGHRDGGFVAEMLSAAAREDPCLAHALDDELRALLVVGHETTAAALAWALERLVREPAVRTDLIDSLREQRTDYLDAFVFEVLRWRAPVVDAVRELREPLEIGHHRIGAGTLVMVSPHLVHHHPDLYPAPAAFVPDRFLGRSSPDPKTWMPFGGGVRRCLGADLAMLEMAVVLDRVLGSFALHQSPSRVEPARLAGTVVLPGHGARITVSRVA